MYIDFASTSFLFLQGIWIYVSKRWAIGLNKFPVMKGRGLVNALLGNTAMPLYRTFFLNVIPEGLEELTSKAF